MGEQVRLKASKPPESHSEVESSLPYDLGKLRDQEARNKAKYDLEGALAVAKDAERAFGVDLPKGPWEEVPVSQVKTLPLVVAQYVQSWSTPRGAGGFDQGCAVLRDGKITDSDRTWDRYAAPMQQLIFGSGEGSYHFFAPRGEWTDTEVGLLDRVKEAYRASCAAWDKLRDGEEAIFQKTVGVWKKKAEAAGLMQAEMVRAEREAYKESHSQRAVLAEAAVDARREWQESMLALETESTNRRRTGLDLDPVLPDPVVEAAIQADTKRARISAGLDWTDNTVERGRDKLAYLGGSAWADMLRSVLVKDGDPISVAAAEVLTDEELAERYPQYYHWKVYRRAQEIVEDSIQKGGPAQKDMLASWRSSELSLLPDAMLDEEIQKEKKG